MHLFIYNVVSPFYKIFCNHVNIVFCMCSVFGVLFEIHFVQDLEQGWMIKRDHLS